jgi:cytosine permease
MASLPSYVAAAKPVPQTNRLRWFKAIAPTYAGVMLWFVFWSNINITDQKAPAVGGPLAAGILPALGGLVVAALICHFLFYLVPGLLGTKTGLPLSVVGTSTYGVTGGFFMPGFLMGLLQFGWLAVNASAVAKLLCECFRIGLKPGSIEAAIPGHYHAVIAIVFAALAAFMGLKGIQYVARVATYLPLIPLVVLVLLFAKTMGGLSSFQPSMLTDVKPTNMAPALGLWGVIAFLNVYIVGFFATAGAAGADIASSSASEKDTQMGGLVGIALATIVAGGLSMLIVAGAYGAKLVPPELAATGDVNPLHLMNGGLFSEGTARIVMILLAISSFPGACFSAFIAATSFRTTLPRVNPFISCGIGTLVSIVLAVTGIADNAVDVFKVIGASFGPICGAMAADYLLAGRKWAGPRAGFNPAGWISWAVGFVLGAIDLVADKVPALSGLAIHVPVPPVAAFIVGFVLYYVLAKAGLESQTLEKPATAE